MEACKILSVQRISSPSFSGRSIVPACKPSCKASIRTRVGPLRVTSQSANAEPSYAGENATTTVFPAEACDTLGEEFCSVEGVFDEVKLPPKAEAPAAPLSGFLNAMKPDVPTVEYDGPKTVFPGEACETLGGEFCAAEYQDGVGKETRA